MQAGRFNGRRISTPHSQCGVILLIALIMLVAMTLAAIGMMRSVDTGSVIAGNLAFKQGTLNATDQGTNQGFTNLMSMANSNNTADKVILNFNNGQPCVNAPGASAATCAGTTPNTGTISLPGYFSSPVSPCEVSGQIAATPQVNGVTCSATQNTWWTNFNWATNAATLPAITDANGNAIATVSYVIHRMCQMPNQFPASIPTKLSATTTQWCQSYSYAPSCKTIPCPPNIVLFYYRITTRSVGVRNNVTYTQMLALISG